MPYFSMNFGRKPSMTRTARLSGSRPKSSVPFLEQIHDAERQRIVRPDDGEFDFLFPRECQQFRQIFRADVDAFDQRAVLGETFLRDAGVARRAP
jgi:hypothetical protein